MDRAGNTSRRERGAVRFKNVRVRERANGFDGVEVEIGAVRDATAFAQEIADDPVIATEIETGLPLEIGEKRADGVELRLLE